MPEDVDAGRSASSLGEVIRRLPPGVDYTVVKQILWSLPPPLTTLLWAARDPASAPFRGWTYRAIDRELQRREGALHALPPEEAARERTPLISLRHQLVTLLASEPASPGSKKKIDSRLLDPSRLHPRPPGIDRLTFVLRVWKATRTGPKILDERMVVSEPRDMGDTTVNWVDPDRLNRAWMELFRKHFPQLMSRRSGHGWRTDRPPVGWPLIAQHAVPALYSYLKPFYPRARPYHRRYHRRRGVGVVSVRAKPTAGRYHMQLLRDIIDILRCELPLAGELTVQRVKGAVRRHVKEHPRKRQPLQEKAPT